MHVWLRTAWRRRPRPSTLSIARRVLGKVKSAAGEGARPTHNQFRIWSGVFDAVNYPAMRSSLRSSILGFLLCLGLAGVAFGSAYNARPKLVVIVVIDQFRGDYLERYRDQWGEGGFRLLLDHGADFTDCNYDYANTRTAPGHATLLTGAYSNGHGIMANEWWEPAKKRLVTSVEDSSTKLVGISGGGTGASPHNLLADTLGDELKLATQGKARVFGVALKDRAAILPAGFAGDGAYWIDQKTGTWITSTYYRSELPKWAQDFNNSKRVEKYLNLEWKDSNGEVLRTTRPSEGKAGSFFELVGSTPFANDYEFEFARELITYEKLGSGPATDLLVVSLSANDILGHQVGPGFPGDAGHGACHGPSTRGLLRVSRTPAGVGQCLDRPLRRSRSGALARRGRQNAFAGGRFLPRQNERASE